MKQSKQYHSSITVIILHPSERCGMSVFGRQVELRRLASNCIGNKKTFSKRFFFLNCPFFQM